MCGRYSIIAKAEKLEKRFNVDVTEAYRPKYNAAPTQLLPVITNESPEGVSFFYWGLIPEWANNKTISTKLINAGAENIHEKASYKNAFKTKRCLIPANNYFEWKQLGKKSKIPYRIFIKNEELFSFAGLWEEYEDENGMSVHSFKIITVPANSVVGEVHERMPVILKQEDERVWISKDSDQEDLLKALAPYPANEMDLYTVSPLVNSPDFESPRIIDQAPSIDQFGNYTLFG